MLHLTTGDVPDKSFETLTYASTLSIAYNPLRPNKKITLTGNTAITLTGTANGSSGIIEFIQDGTGARTAVIAGSSVTLNPTASGSTIIGWFYNGTNYRFDTNYSPEISSAVIAYLQGLSGYVGDGTKSLRDNLTWTTSGTSLTALSTPTLTATVISSTQIDLSWTNVANESSYVLQRSVDGSTGWTTINSPAANTTTYSNTGLTASTHYYYRIKAVGDGVTYSDSGYGTDDDTTSASGDVTAPTIVSMVAHSSSRIRATFSEPMSVVSVAGFFFSNGSDLPRYFVSQITNTIFDFGTAGISSGDTVTYSYDADGGATVDVAGNELANISTSSVTNSIAATSALSGTPFSSAEYSSEYVASKAFDADLGTFFSANDASDCYLGIDLGTAKSLTAVSLYPRTSYTERLQNLIIEGSNTSATTGYTALMNTSTFIDGGTYNFFGIAGSYRWVRIRRGTASGLFTNLDCTEMKVNGYA